MTAGLSIGIDAKGGSQAEAELKRVAKGADAIAAAEGKAAAAAKLRGHAQQEANGHAYRSAHGGAGAHGALGHNLHLAGLAGGEVGHLGHLGARAARYGGAGLAVAGVGFALNMAVSSAVEAGEKAGQLEEAIQSLGAKLKAARDKLGEAGLGAADAHGFSLRRIGNAGGTFADVRKWQGEGVGPDALASLMGGQNWKLGAQVSALAGRLGADPNSIASSIGAAGGVRDDQDPKALAKYYAERALGRRIGGSEFARAMEGGGEIGERITQIQGFNNRASSGAYAAIEEGKAGSAAAMRMSKALSPEAAAMTEAWAAATEKSKVLSEISSNTNIMAQAFQGVMHKLGIGEAPAATQLLQHNEQTQKAFAAAGAAGE